MKTANNKQDAASQTGALGVRRIALGTIWLYKHTFSPFFYALGVRCRHEPTCSSYAADAFRKHTAGRAFWLAVSRLSRCHPLGSHGFDPVDPLRALAA